MQNPNPVIKNYIFSSEPFVIKDSGEFKTLSQSDFCCTPHQEAEYIQLYPKLLHRI